MAVWVGGWLDQLEIKPSQLSTELKLKLKLSLAKTVHLLDKIHSSDSSGRLFRP